jgi:uncharacterized membrane protein YqjE
VIREATGALGDLKGIASTAVRAVRTRLELISIEVEEEKAWAVRFIIAAVAALYLLTFGLLLAIFAIVLFAPEENRAAILAVGAGAFLAAGAGAGMWLGARARSRQPLFDDTIAVLKGDERGLQELARGTGD